MQKFIIYIPMIIGFLACNAHAELIFLKNGTVIRSNIVEINQVYIRTTNKDAFAQNEYLVDNIERIEPDKTQEQQISELAIANIRLQQNNVINKKLRKAALQKASEIIASTIQEIDINDLNQAPQEAKSAALAVANQLVLEALEVAHQQHKNESLPKPTTKTLIENAAEHIAVENKESPQFPKETTYTRREIFSNDHQIIYQLLPNE